MTTWKKQVISKSDFGGLSSDVLTWDSHLPLQRAYADLCRRKEALREGADDCWRCGNPTHSGMVMFEHYAQVSWLFTKDKKKD